MREVRGLGGNPEAPINQLATLSSKADFLAVVVFPRSVFPESAAWCDSYLDKFAEIEKRLEAGNMGSAYDVIVKVRSYVLRMNSYADDRIQTGITDLVKVMDKFSAELAKVQ